MNIEMDQVIENSDNEKVQLSLDGDIKIFDNQENALRKKKKQNLFILHLHNFFVNKKIIINSKQKVRHYKNYHLLSLFLIVLKIYHYLYSDQTNQEAYLQFLDNINQDIIVDFYIEWNETTCKQPFKPLFIYNYRREIKFCECSQSRNISELKDKKLEVTVGRGCTQQELKQQCISFTEELIQDLIYLNNNQFGAQFLICVKREEGISLSNNQTYCQKQEKTVCGNSTTYCLPKNISCPISEFGIETFEHKPDDQKNTLIYLGDNKYFYFRNNTNYLPISQVYLISGKKMCKLNKQLAYSEKQIFIKHEQESCQDKDQLFKKVYELSEEQLFLSNNLIQYKNELNHFYIDKNHSWSLQAKSYTQISDECQENQLYQTILTNDYQKQIEISNILQLIFSILLPFLIWLIWKLCLCVIFNDKCKEKLCSCSYSSSCSCLVQRVINAIFPLFFYFLFSLISYIKFKNQIEVIKQISKCIQMDDANNYLNYTNQNESYILNSYLFYYLLISFLMLTKITGIKIKRINKQKYRLINQV